MEIKYGGLSWRGDQYANISVDIEVLNELKSVLEDLIVDYARVKNFDGIEEAIASRDEILTAIEEVTPEPIPETEQEADEEEVIPVKWLLSLSDNPLHTDTFRNCVDGAVKLWREKQEDTDEEA